MIYCCDEFMEIIDTKLGQHKCKCAICGKVALYQPYRGD
jgi:hypothetical protein